MDQLVEPSILEVLSSNQHHMERRGRKNFSTFHIKKNKNNLVILGTSRTSSPCSGPAASLKKFFSASLALLCNCHGLVQKPLPKMLGKLSFRL